jgi:hypothetical protein
VHIDGQAAIRSFGKHESACLGRAHHCTKVVLTEHAFERDTLGLICFERANQAISNGQKSLC